jgi:hypothetical protein
MHPFSGFSGVVTVVTTSSGIGICSYRVRKKVSSYNHDPGGRPGAFEPFLQKYLRLAEFLIGLATGGIILLIGSSSLHGQAGRLPWFYASPLLCLAASVLTGLLFMAWQILSYEETNHGNRHGPLSYSLSETFGFSSLAFFVIGYSWLIIAVTR